MIFQKKLCKHNEYSEIITIFAALRREKELTNSY